MVKNGRWIRTAAKRQGKHNIAPGTRIRIKARSWSLPIGKFSLLLAFMAGLH